VSTGEPDISTQGWIEGDTPAHETAAGNVPALPVSPPDASEATRTHARETTKRLQAEGRWFGQAEQTRNDLMAEAKAGGMTKAQAQAWTYSELDKMYPPVQAKPAEAGEGFVGIKGVTATKPIYIGSSDADSGQIQGLSNVPEDWPDLPSNASLAVEIGWVQANRLRMVTEKPGGATVVSLSKALSPAPSWAALGWLETSIRSYAKFVDVAAKVSGADSDEGAVMKRERRSVDEVKALLASMEEATGACPHCGRSG
jgi:hypothetical protein